MEEINKKGSNVTAFFITNYLSVYYYLCRYTAMLFQIYFSVAYYLGYYLWSVVAYGYKLQPFVVANMKILLQRWYQLVEHKVMAIYTYRET